MTESLGVPDASEEAAWCSGSPTSEQYGYGKARGTIGTFGMPEGASYDRALSGLTSTRWVSVEDLRCLVRPARLGAGQRLQPGMAAGGVVTGVW